jgi:hypothetical protein
MTAPNGNHKKVIHSATLNHSSVLSAQAAHEGTLNGEHLRNAPTPRRASMKTKIITEGRAHLERSHSELMGKLRVATKKLRPAHLLMAFHDTKL